MRNRISLNVLKYLTPLGCVLVLTESLRSHMTSNLLGVYRMQMSRRSAFRSRGATQILVMSYLHEPQTSDLVLQNLDI